jgi:hypothetical protein
MKAAALAVVAIAIGISVGFWVAPPFGSFSILAKPVSK